MTELKIRAKARVDSRGTPHGGIAQLGEHLLCKQGVNGSSPFISTMTTSLWSLGIGLNPAFSFILGL